jgi:ethanolamine ammonia-lyase large subunit
VMGLRRAPEFEAWLEKMHIVDTQGDLRELPSQHGLLRTLTDMTQVA